MGKSRNSAIHASHVSMALALVLILVPAVLFILPPAGFSQVASAETGERPDTSRLRQTEAQIRTSLAENPESFELHGDLGQVLLKQGNYEDAAREFGLAAQHFPASRAYNIGLAEALIGWGHYEVAVEFLKAVRPKFQQYPEYHYYLGMALYDFTQVREALPEFEEALRLDPNLDQARFYIAACRATIGDLTSAATVYQSLVKNHPTNPNYWLALAQVLDKMGVTHQAEALRAYRRALALRPGNPGIEYKLALILIKLNNFSAARPLLEHVIQSNPDEVQPHMILARTYSRLGQSALAREQSKIATKLEASNPKHMVKQ